MHVSKVQFWDDSESKQHRQWKQTLKEHWEIASCLNQLINRAVILETTKPSPAMSNRASIEHAKRLFFLQDLDENRAQ